MAKTVNLMDALGVIVMERKRSTIFTKTIGEKVTGTCLGKKLWSTMHELGPVSFHPFKEEGCSSIKMVMNKLIFTLS